jgi:hypothetical protein
MGGTIEEVRTRMKEAIEFHVEGHQLEGFPIPAPTSKAFFFPISGRKEALRREACRNAYDNKDFCEEGMA